MIQVMTKTVSSHRVHVAAFEATGDVKHSQWSIAKRSRNRPRIERESAEWQGQKQFDIVPQKYDQKWRAGFLAFFTPLE